MPTSPATQPSWKQEVNRRLAEHKNRKGISVIDEQMQDGDLGTSNSRAAAAAARVAARYANVPSYSEMQAAEARAALRAAEAATRVALEAQAAARAALANLEASDEELEVERCEQLTTHIRPEPATHPYAIQWEPDLPVRNDGPEDVDSIAGNWWPPSQIEQDLTGGGEVIEHVEGAQPIHANLIEFPRELVATRRMRPRLTESNVGFAEPYAQLSIFEVDPGTISIEPPRPEEEVHLPSWNDREWAAIELDERRSSEPVYYEAPVAAAPLVHQAPAGRRTMAIMVDFALIFGLVSAMAAFAASKLPHLPGLKASEVTAMFAIAVVGVLYECLFLLYAKSTPGMRYAELSLCTFDDEHPTREQVKARLVAMLLSLLPMGLGMLWAIFDEDNMSWHDRHSRTYLRLS